MNIVGTFSRAFKIIRQNPKLWVLGFLAALNSAESGISGSSNINVPSGGGPGTGTTPGAGNETIEQIGRIVQEAITTLTNNTGLLIGVIGGFICLLLIANLLVLLISEIAHGGLIANIDRIENDQKPSIGDGFRAGANRAGALMGQKLLLGLPSLILSMVAFAIIGVALISIFSQARASGSSAGGSPVAFFALAPLLLCIFLPLICVGWLYNIAAQLLSQFGRRAIVLEGQGAVGGLKRGWAVIKSNGTDTLVMAMLVYVLRLVIGIVVGIMLVLITVPALVGVTATLRASEQTVIWLGLIGVVLFVALTVVTAVLSTLIVTFESSLWTLTYRTFLRLRTPELAQRGATL